MLIPVILPTVVIHIIFNPKGAAAAWLVNKRAGTQMLFFFFFQLRKGKTTANIGFLWFGGFMENPKLAICNICKMLKSDVGQSVSGSFWQQKKTEDGRV